MYVLTFGVEGLCESGGNASVRMVQMEGYLIAASVLVLSVVLPYVQLVTVVRAHD